MLISIGPEVSSREAQVISVGVRELKLLTRKFLLQRKTSLSCDPGEFFVCWGGGILVVFV